MTRRARFAKHGPAVNQEQAETKLGVAEPVERGDDAVGVGGLDPQFQVDRRTRKIDAPIVEAGDVVNAVEQEALTELAGAESGAVPQLGFERP